MHLHFISFEVRPASILKQSRGMFKTRGLRGPSPSALMMFTPRHWRLNCLSGMSIARQHVQGVTGRHHNCPSWSLFCGLLTRSGTTGSSPPVVQYFQKGAGGDEICTRRRTNKRNNQENVVFLRNQPFHKKGSDAS